MPRTLSNWEYRQLLSEGQKLMGRRLEKVYEPNPGLFRFDFSFGDSLVVKLGKYFYLTQEPPAAPQNPSGFAMYLRKYLEGRKLEAFEGMGSDRIYRLSFREAPVLLLEQFAGGNLFLLDGEERIMRAYHAKPSEKRQYKSGQKYEYPPSASFSFPPGKKEWEAALQDKPSASLSSLLGRWPIGKIYTQTLLEELGWEGKKANELDGRQVDELLGRLADRMAAVTPKVYEEKEAEGEVAELALVALARFEQPPCTPKLFPSFSQAVEYFFSHVQTAGPQPESPHFIRLRKRMEEQQAGLERLEKEIEAGSQETRWLEENLHTLEERREKILGGETGKEKVDEKKRIWKVSD
ncbi:Uncharacterised protein [uncultured archaeon]|nr:Uncharacterised protein [uncultured archaeon]